MKNIVIPFMMLLLASLSLFIGKKCHAQPVILNDILKFQTGEIFVSEHIAETTSQVAIGLPIVKDRKLHSRSLFEKWSFQLKDSTRRVIEVSKFLDSVFLFEQFDSNYRLQARGYIIPDLRQEIDHQVSVIDVITGEETIYNHPHFKLMKTSDWQISFYGSKYEFGKYENDLKTGSWQLQDTTLPDDVIFREDIYGRGVILSRRNFDLSHESDKVIKHCFKSRDRELFIGKDPEIIIAKTDSGTAGSARAFGWLTIVDPSELLLKRNSRCAAGIDIDKEAKAQKWDIKDKVLRFGNYKLKIEYIDEDMIVFRNLHEHIDE